MKYYFSLFRLPIMFIKRKGLLVDFIRLHRKIIGPEILELNKKNIYLSLIYLNNSFKTKNIW